MRIKRSQIIENDGAVVEVLDVNGSPPATPATNSVYFNNNAGALPIGLVRYDGAMFVAEATPEGLFWDSANNTLYQYDGTSITPAIPTGGRVFDVLTIATQNVVPNLSATPEDVLEVFFVNESSGGAGTSANGMFTVVGQAVTYDFAGCGTNLEVGDVIVAQYKTA